MTLRPADLLECIRQMSDSDRMEFVALIGKELSKQVWNTPIKDVVSLTEISDEVKQEMVKAIKNESISGPILIPSKNYELPSDWSEPKFEYFIASKKECPNCTKLMMQCESHYRCWHCGNMEYETDNQIKCPVCDNQIKCPDCGHYYYTKIDDTMNYVDWKCFKCNHEDRIMKQ